MKIKIKILLSLIFVMIGIINYLNPLFADDYIYSFIFGTNHRIKSILDVLISQKKHYFQWGGRTIAHIAGESLLMLPKYIRVILNTFVFTFMIKKISDISKLGRENNCYNIILILFTYWLCHPSLAESNFWIIGSVNYMWTMLLGIFYLEFFIKEFFNENKEGKIKINIAILSFLSGWSNENFAPIILLFSITILLWKWFEKRVLKKSNIIYIILNFIGLLFLILAPGNKVRANQTVFFKPWQILTFQEKIINHIPRFIKSEESYLLIIVLILILILIKINQIDFKKRILIGYLMALSLICNLIMFISPTTPIRTYTSGFILLIVAFSVTLSLVSNKNKFVLLVIMSVFFFNSYIATLKSYIILNKENNIRNKILLNNEKEVRIPRFTIKNKRNVFVRDIEKDSNIWTNSSVAKFYKKDKISGIDYDYNYSNLSKYVNKKDNIVFDYKEDLNFENEIIINTFKVFEDNEKYIFIGELKTHKYKNWRLAIHIVNDNKVKYGDFEYLPLYYKDKYYIFREIKKENLKNIKIKNHMSLFFYDKFGKLKGKIINL